MSNLTKLNQLLKNQSIKADSIEATQLLDYADNISRIENVTAVVSDLRRGTSRIFPGKFGILSRDEAACQHICITLDRPGVN